MESVRLQVRDALGQAGSVVRYTRRAQAVLMPLGDRGRRLSSGEGSLVKNGFDKYCKSFLSLYKKHQKQQGHHHVNLGEQIWRGDWDENQHA